MEIETDLLKRRNILDKMVMLRRELCDLGDSLGEGGYRKGEIVAQHELPEGELVLQSNGGGVFTVKEVEGNFPVDYITKKSAAFFSKQSAEVFFDQVASWYIEIARLFVRESFGENEQQGGMKV